MPERGYTGYNAEQVALTDRRVSALTDLYGVQPDFVGSGIDPTAQRRVLATLKAKLSQGGPRFPGSLTPTALRADMAHITRGGDILTRPSLGGPATGEVIRDANGKLLMLIRETDEVLPSRRSTSGISSVHGTIDHEFGHVVHLSAPRSAHPAAALSPDILESQTFHGVVRAFEDSIPKTTRYSGTNTHERIAEALRLHTTGQRTFPQIDMFRQYLAEANNWPGTMTPEAGAARIQQMIDSFG